MTEKILDTVNQSNLIHTVYSKASAELPWREILNKYCHLSKVYNSVWQTLKKVSCWSACQVSYNLLSLHSYGRRSNKPLHWEERDLAQLSFPGLQRFWPGSISASTGRLLAFTSVRKVNGREWLTFSGAQSGKWYVIQTCQGEWKKMRGEGKQRERASYSQGRGMKKEVAFVIRDTLHFFVLKL